MQAYGDGPPMPNLVRPTLVRMAALPLRVVEVTPGPPGVAAAQRALVDRLDAKAAPFALVPRPSRHVSAEYAATILRCVRPDLPVADPDTAFIAATSGSTGQPRGVVITRDNLRAAVHSSWAHIAGLRECSWVLALPITSIGGFGAVVRAHLAGTALHVLDSVGGAAPFDARDLVALPVTTPFAISLVPRQLADLLDSPEGTTWLSKAHTVLVGAAATPEALTTRARDAGVPVVPTYGMTETTGGCVYDGVPLPGVQVDLAPDGRIDIIGEQVAAGYREGDDAFSGQGPTRRFRTSDHGVFEHGRLRVIGRNDDVVTVHGVNVALGAIESLIREMVVVRECAVVSVPDDRQGHRIRAFVVTSDPSGAESIATAVAEQLGSAAKPEIALVPSLPLLPNGKIDRLALRALAQGL